MHAAFACVHPHVGKHGVCCHALEVLLAACLSSYHRCWVHVLCSFDWVAAPRVEVVLGCSLLGCVMCNQVLCWRLAQQGSM